MFCNKCGEKLAESASFCNKCGNRQKSRSKKPLFAIAGVAVVAVVAIVIAMFVGNGSGEPPDLFQIALNASPMEEFGFDATYGDLFGWLMSSRRTSLDQQGNVAYLTFLGNVTGGDYPVSVVLRMTGLSPDAPDQRLEPHAMTLNGMEIPDFNNPEGVLMELFWAQDNDEHRTFMDFVSWDNEFAFGTFMGFVGGEPSQALQPTHSQVEEEWTTITNLNKDFTLRMPISWTYSHGEWDSVRIADEDIGGTVSMSVNYVSTDTVRGQIEDSTSSREFFFDNSNRGLILEFDDRDSMLLVDQDSGFLISIMQSIFTDNEDLILQIAKSLTPTTIIQTPTAITEIEEEWITVTTDDSLSMSFPSWFSHSDAWAGAVGIEIYNDVFRMTAFWGGELIVDGALQNAIVSDIFLFNDGNTGYFIREINSITFINGRVYATLWHGEDDSIFTNNETLIMQIARTLTYIPAVADIEGLVGIWHLDYFHDYFSDVGDTDPFFNWFVGGEILEFFADGTGIERFNGTEWTFTWSLEVNPPWGDSLVMSHPSFESRSLGLYNYGNVMYLGWRSEGPPTYIAFTRIP